MKTLAKDHIAQAWLYRTSMHFLPLGTVLSIKSRKILLSDTPAYRMKI